MGARGGGPFLLLGKVGREAGTEEGERAGEGTGRMAGGGIQPEGEGLTGAGRGGGWMAGSPGEVAPREAGEQARVPGKGGRER